MYTMDAALQEIAITDLRGIPKGLVPAAGVNNFGGNNIWIWVIAILVIACCCGGNNGVACFEGGRRRRRRGRRRIGNGLIFLIFLALLLLGGNNGGRNVNTNVINVETDNLGEDDIIDL